VFIVENVVIGKISQTLHLDDQMRGRSSHAERSKEENGYPRRSGGAKTFGELFLKFD
jgi:hypothetical protein